MITEGRESYPGLPWFRWTLSIIPKVVTEDKKGQRRELPFICFALLDNEPMILGTNGCRKKIFGQTLTANLAPPLPYTTGCDENDLTILYTNHPFNWGINFTLYRLGDPRVMGDVYRFRNSYTQLKALRHENDTLARLIKNIQKEQEQHNADIGKFSWEIVAVQECLVAAKVHS